MHFIYVYLYTGTPSIIFFIVSKVKIRVYRVGIFCAVCINDIPALLVGGPRGGRGVRGFLLSGFKVKYTFLKVKIIY